MSESTLDERRDLTSAQRFYVDFLIDVLIYTVVLNTFVELVDSVVIDSYLVSLLAAVVLKAMIDLIDYSVSRIKHHFAGREGTSSKVLFGLAAWGVMFASKFAVLWVIQIIFEDDVDLGGFVNVLLIVAAMMLARRASTKAFVRLGSDGSTPLEPWT